MPQLSWSITGHTGQIYRLGLFHGDADGHVVVHCNDKVMAIDFNVAESKTYSVFLDQELCEVSIDHTGGNNFDYDCRINREVDTPLNERRNKLKEEDRRMEQLQLIGLLAVGIVLLLIWWF
ncbi:hypothetical protein [Neolewinella antarctica]|uniref:Uncharacterized protein n=1 Tax=Neolewinella antarctica TaxID=442734 RepID=A0ABX0XFJ1_9BACT|nr:hypothetical protein [Neolewinella antarctica]NJC28088.1 hypothetical protein [Neolewinella antarctica]